jgi:hypothetical protein
LIIGGCWFRLKGYYLIDNVYIGCVLYLFGGGANMGRPIIRKRLWDKVCEIAEYEGVRPSEIIEDAIEDYIEAYEEELEEEEEEEDVEEEDEEVEEEEEEEEEV